jgi:hypothetical protein
MATYDYRNLSTGEIQEIIHLPHEKAPRKFERDGEVWERLFPAPRIVTADTRGFKTWPSEKELLAQGKRPVEAGHTKDVERNRRDIQKKKDQELEESVVASVNRAMP